MLKKISLAIVALFALTLSLNGATAQGPAGSAATPTAPAAAMTGVTR